MSPDPTNQLIEYVSRLTSKTVQGDVHWARPNPTVFVWDPNPPTGSRISIQRVVERKLSTTGPRRIEVISYLFQIVDPTNKSAAMSLDSRERPNYLEAMRALYEAASLSIDRRAAQVLGDLLTRLDPSKPS
jgi:hypothetical protein